MEILLYLIMIVLLIVYISKTNGLTRQITLLEFELDSLRRKISSPAPTVAPPPITIKPEEKTSQSITPSLPDQPTPAVKPSVSRPPVAAKPAEKTSPPIISQIPIQPTTAADAPAPTPPRPSRTRAEWEALIGGKLLNRIGAVALILGIGFFLKYAFDNNLISETMRVVIGFGTGIGLLLLGSRTHQKELQIFAQGLFGAGVSILYLSVYASFNFYHLVPQTAAFGLMSGVTALAFFLALKYDSLAISCLGWIGGFLTPIMLSTGQANEVGLFTYVALLDAGLLAVLFKKEAWVVLEPLTLVATYVMYFLWYSDHYQPENLPVTVLFLSIFWGLFYGLDVIRTLKAQVTFPHIRQAVAGANAAFYCAAIYGIINPEHHAWMGAVMLAIAAVYFFTFLGLKRRQPESVITLARYALTAIILLTWATEIQFDGFNTVIFWSLEALILIWCGIHWDLRYVWQAALSVLGLGLLKLFLAEGAFKYSAIEDFTLLFNHRALAFAVLAATLGASAAFFKSVQEEMSGLIRELLHASWSILLFLLLTVEISDFFRRRMIGAIGEAETSLVFKLFLTWAASWLMYSLPLVWLGLRYRILPILYTGVCVLALAIVMVAIQGLDFRPIAEFTLVRNWRAAVFALVIVGTVVQSRWLENKRQMYAWIDSFIPVLHSAIALLLFALGTVEVNDFFRRRMMGATGEAAIGLEFNRFLTWATIWTIYSLPLVWLGLRHKILPFLYAGLGGIGLAAVMVAIQGIAFKPIAEFAVMLNWRVAGFVLVIAGVFLHTHWLQKHVQTYSWAGDFINVARVAMALMLFELGTAEVNDFFHQRMASTTGETATGLAFNRFMTWAALWMVYSLPLVWFGLRRQVLPILYIGFGIMGLAVLTVTTQGLTFDALAQFTPALNTRAFVFVLVIAGVVLHSRWLQAHRQSYPWSSKVLGVLQVTTVLLILELLTGETRDIFRRAILALQHKTGVAGVSEEIIRLRNLQQLVLSGVWLLYSVALMVAGIWRRMQGLRIIAIILFGATILKIFAYDLSFLQTLYRIYSFIGLGVILLTVSY
ncbi:MAG: DUF2339 domain-containing protein, partial [bacterium]